MGKISPVSSKYIINTNIQIEGVVDRPDVIGAIFGQTEGLLGAELELRELQRSGRIGRIEVKLETKAGKSEGQIIIPSSLDKAETVIIAAALETIQRIGPCNAKVKIDKVEDIRVSKRNFVIDRAKELLRKLTDEVLPDSQEITDEVTSSVRMMEITEYGKDRLPSGPNINEAEEIIVVEGRADVLNLLKHGVKNVIGMNGTSVPQTIIELSRKKIVTLFVDGDRGGDLIIKEMSEVAEVDYVIKAPDWKEMGIKTEKDENAVGRDAWSDLIAFITEGPVVALVLEGVHAVEVVRKITGSTSPHKAQPGTIRGDYSHISMGYATHRGFGGRNLIHASGSKEEAEQEIKLWFKKDELFKYKGVQDEHLV